MALRAARNAGLYVPHETIDRCIDYVKRSQNADGGFMYMIQGGQSAFPRSAAGVVALYSAGIYEGAGDREGPRLPDGASCRRRRRSTARAITSTATTTPCRPCGTPAASTGGSWYPAIRDELLARQRDDGSWMDSICQEYGTRHGLHHPADAQQLFADFSAVAQAFNAGSAVGKAMQA